jgi:hypothetical protein
MTKNHKFAFPDTNIFLHFQFFTEISWDEVLKAKSVTLVIPPIISRELDKHKYNHPSEKVKERASKVTKKFAEILRSNGEIRPKVTIQFERIEPQSEFEKYNLSKESQDDHFIASIIRFQNETGNNAMLVTNDFALIVKAHQLNIEVFEIPEEYQTKSEENPDKKKIAKLEKELIELKDKTPKLKLVSIDENEKIVGQALSTEDFSGIENELEINKIKEKYPQITKTYKPKKEIRLIINEKPLPAIVEYKLPSGEIKQAHLSEIEKYNNELKEFYEKYEKYLNRMLWINNLRGRTIKLQLKIKNEGTVPANGIHVILTFPKAFIIMIGEEPFSYPREINPPKLSPMKSLFTGSFTSKQSIAEYMPQLNLGTPKFPKVKMIWEEVTVKEKDSIYTASFQSIKLSHGYSFDCPETIYVVFPKNYTAKSFQIKYKIAADNLPTAIEGKILVSKQN